MTITRETLEALKKTVPHKYRIQSATQYNALCVAYIDARQVMDMLDQIVGNENWQDHYREVAGKVYCDLSIKVDGEWITKSDCGSESNHEAEKGQASDAFKRAAVKWGIGRFLYSLTMLKLPVVQDGKDYKGKPKFAATSIAGDPKKKFYGSDDLSAVCMMARYHMDKGLWQNKATEAALADWNKGIKSYSKSSEKKSTEPSKKTNNGASPALKEEIKSLCQQKNIGSEQLKSKLKSMKISWSNMTKENAEKIIQDLKNIKS